MKQFSKGLSPPFSECSLQKESSMPKLDRVIETIYREEGRRVFATLVRLVGDFELAEEAMHEAFEVAVKKWPQEGLPSNPRSWLISTARFKAIDVIRRRDRFQRSQEELVLRHQEIEAVNEQRDYQEFEDDRLKLIFTCCHPSIALEIQVALTLREVCGLTTEQVAGAFLVSHTAMAQRIVRGKAKIRLANIPYRVPQREELGERLDSVLTVIYLVFNEGYSDLSPRASGRQVLSEEAIRLARLVLELLPDPEVEGLLALMLLHESRRRARTTPEGRLILLENQDRSLWDQERIREGSELAQRALSSAEIGPYSLQAAIAAVHSEAESADSTDWNQIVALYNLLRVSSPSPVVDLNRAVAIALSGELELGLQEVESLLEQGELSQYHLAHAARADLCRRLGLVKEARVSYEQALKLAKQPAEKDFLQQRLQDLRTSQA